MKLEWSAQAVEDMLQIDRYYLQFSVPAAQDTLDRIILRCEDLTKFPYQGPAHPDLDREDVRAIIVDYYRITYQVLDNIIQIHTVFDWRQDPSRER